MLVEGPRSVNVTVEQERLCRLVVRMEESTLCVAEDSESALIDAFRAEDGWSVGHFPPARG